MSKAYWAIGGLVTYLVVCGFFVWLLWSGGKETQKTVGKVGDHITKSGTEIQTAIEASGKKTAQAITDSFDALKEELGKKPTLSTPAPTAATAPAPTVPALSADDIPSLIQQLKEEPGDIAKQAADNLVKCKGEAVPKLVEVLSDKRVRERAKWCLMEIGEPAIDALVNTGFASCDQDVRETAISAAVSIGGQKTRNKLIEAAADSGRPRVMNSAQLAKRRLAAKEMEPTPIPAAVPQPPAKKAVPSRP